MDLQLAGKVALVMAASKGLGRASAESLAREGANVSICARSELIYEVAEAIAVEHGVEAIASQVDVTKQADIERVVQETLAEFGRIDILIINAGGPPPGMFFDLTADDWEAAVQLTLMSAVHLCYAVIPHMLEQGSGSIVAIESVSVKQPVANLILSNSIRMAVIGMLKSLANEFGSRGIRINSVNPTYTWTGRIQQLLEDRAARSGKTVAELKAGMGASLPIGRIGTVEEFGNTVAWIASPAASFIHGHALMFDGGATQTPL